ncbi:hypothetical protein Tco_1202058 [Tanacetum coccineum]
MQNCSPTVAPVVKGDKFGAYQCPKNKLEQEEMRFKPYASVHDIFKEQQILCDYDKSTKLPMTICANTAAKDVNKMTATKFILFAGMIRPKKEYTDLDQQWDVLSFLRSILVLLVVTYGTAVSFAAAYEKYVLLSAKFQEN